MGLSLPCVNGSSIPRPGIKKAGPSLEARAQDSPGVWGSPGMLRRGPRAEPLRQTSESPFEGARWAPAGAGRGAERPLEAAGSPAPCARPAPAGPAPRPRAAHARGAALRGRRERGRSAAARRSALHSCWAVAARPRSGARARRRPRPGRLARLRRPCGGAGGVGGADDGARRWPAAGRAPGQPVSRGATFPRGAERGRAGVPGGGRAGVGGALRLEHGGLRPGRGACGRASRGCARGTAARVSAGPRVPAAPARRPRVSGRGRGAGAELVVSPPGRDRTSAPGPAPPAAPRPPRPGPPRSAGQRSGRLGWGRGPVLPPPQKQERKFAAAPEGGPRGCPGRTRGWTADSDPRPPAGPGWAGLGRPGPGCAAAWAGPREPEEVVRGCILRWTSGRCGGSWSRFLGTDARPRPLWPRVPGDGRCVRAWPAGPLTRAGRGRCGCRPGGRPTRSGLFSLPLSGPLQGQSSSLGGFRLLPGPSRAWWAA